MNLSITKELKQVLKITFLIILQMNTNLVKVIDMKVKVEIILRINYLAL